MMVDMTGASVIAGAVLPRSHTDTVILPDSPEAATYREDVKGWVSRKGMFYGDGPDAERAARYSGSTHSYCTHCNGIADKSRLFCNACMPVIDRQRWEKLELVEWDGVTPLVLHRSDEYFFDRESIDEYADEYGVKVSELDLVVCKPNVARELDPDNWSDSLADDGELPDWLEKTIAEFNTVIHAHRDEPLSWSAGDKRVILEDACYDEADGAALERDSQP